MKTILIAILLLCSPSLGYAAFARTSVATDDFNRAAPIGANWATTNTFNCSNMLIYSSIQTGGSHESTTHPCAARWVGAGTFTDDQYTQATIKANMSVPTNEILGVSCRTSADVDAAANNQQDRYEFSVQRNTSGSAQTTRIVKIVNGVRTTLTSAAVLWVATDVISMECTGGATTLIEGFKNGVTQMNFSDSSTPLTTGQPGILSGGIDTFLDDWSAGSLAAAVFTTGRRRVSSQ